MRKVLIVDDEKIVRESTSDLLRSRGFETFQAEDGHAASLKLIGENEISLVLVDIRMPVVDGPTLVDVIKLQSPQAKIIVSSVHTLDDQKRLINNADAYHQKSEGQDMLMVRIENIMKNRVAPIKISKTNKHRLL